MHLFSDGFSSVRGILAETGFRDETNIELKVYIFVASKLLADKREV
jgi:hypothetical protein